MAVFNRPSWKYVRGLAPPLLVLAVLVGWLGHLLYTQAQHWQQTDEDNLREWLNESQVFRKTLPEMSRDYLEQQRPEQAEEIYEQLKAMGNPLRINQGQLPLFPDIYLMEVRFSDPSLSPIAWGEEPSGSRRGQQLEYNLFEEKDKWAKVRIKYQLHAYNRRQRDQELRRQALFYGVGGLALAAVVLAAAWIYLFLKNERARELHRLMAQRQVEHAEKQALENELRRQEAEHKQEEMERSLLEQRLATQAAEGQALELKSQLYASISIMAGSYAHNIKNLLVRPNDLLSRCLEADRLSGDQQHMISEVRQTLGTVTERLQQILRTVRRDPTRSELSRLDLNAVVRDIVQTWEDLARDKWKLTLTAELHADPLWIEGDLSHLQQAAENLLFNARDATFEMRSHLREEARRVHPADSQQMRQALIDAASWKGSTVIRTRREGDRAVLEVQDNGIGMSEEVRQHCTETHFSTKRDNAIYEGISTGMGLGLSFVVVILEHHRATLDIESQPLKGALFRASFPVASISLADNVQTMAAARDG
jgi:signal transduction histidine kinase